MKMHAFLIPSLLALAVAAGCTQSVADGDAPATAGATQPESRHMVMHTTPWCGCCTAWADQARTAGFEVEVVKVEDLAPVKAAAGVPAAQMSCHTAEIDGYFIEGHVPFDDIKRLLAERPQARGLAVPGMPHGSPGMESPTPQPYSVNLVGDDGSVTEYARYSVTGTRSTPR